MDNITGISNRIISATTWWVALLATIIFLGFSVTVLPDQSEKAEVYSAEIGSPDLSLFYSSEDLYQMAKQYGQEGRQAYIRARFSFDLAFPIVYGAFLLFSSALSLKKLTKTNSPWRLLLFIPIMAVLFDLLENVSAAIVIGRFPQSSDSLAYLAPFFTLFKWFFVGSGFILTFAYFVILIWRQIKK